MNFKNSLWLGIAIISAGTHAWAEDLSLPPSREKVKEEEVILSEKVTNVISLEKAIARAIDNSPRLKSAFSAKEAAEGEKLQSKTLPNPEISVEAENIAGGGDYKGFDSAEVTYGVSQLIEIGGKRDARKDIAGKGVDLAKFQLEQERQNLIRDVKTAYAEAVTAEALVKLAKEQKDLAAEVLGSVTKRVNAAADPLYQKNKAQVANSTSKIAFDKAERNAIIAKQKLATLWGEKSREFDLDLGSLFEITPPEDIAVLEEKLKNTPDYKRWEVELEQKKSQVELEEANAIPDPSVNIGVRDLRESGNQAFVAGISIPIPVFNSNSGNISKAKAESLKAESDGMEAKNQLVSELNRNWQELQNAYKQSESFKKEIIPAAEESFKLARQGYGIGKFPYLEVLDAQRTLFNSREEYYYALKQYHISKAEVARLTANAEAKENKELSEVKNEKAQ